MKKRIDQLLVERGTAESRHKAQALVLAGQVLVNEQKILKPGQTVNEESEIRLLDVLPFASRAGGKLKAAGAAAAGEAAPCSISSTWRQ